MELAAGLPREADRTGPLGNAQRYMRYQWITRLLGNPLVVSDAIMEPFSREVLERAAVGGQPLVLILDQSKVSDRHQVLMLALRCGERALPLAWRVERTDGAIGFDTQRALLGAVARWLPEQAKVRLLGDRFYGTADLIGWCQERGWDYRLRLKGNLVVFDGAGRTTTGQCAKRAVRHEECAGLSADPGQSCGAAASLDRHRCPHGRSRSPRTLILPAQRPTPPWLPYGLQAMHVETLTTRARKF